MANRHDTPENAVTPAIIVTARLLFYIFVVNYDGEMPLLTGYKIIAVPLLIAFAGCAQAQASSYAVCGQYLGKWGKPPVEICRKKAPLPDMVWLTRSDTGYFYFWKGRRINQYIKYFEEAKK